MEVYLSGKRNIYEEIVETYTKYIRTGALRAGEKLPSCRGLAMQLGINPNTVERAYSELEKRGLIRTLPKKGAFVREEAEEKPPDVPGMESGEAGGDTARDPAGGTAASPKQGPAAKQGALAGDRQEPAAKQGALAGAERQEPAAMQGALAGDRQEPAAKQGALAGAERQEALADAERQEALLRAKEALLRLRQAGVSAAEAHALIKQLFGEAEKGEKR